MIYKFTYVYNNQLIYENYDNETKAMIRFNYLIENNIPFRIITILKKGKRKYGSKI